MTSREIAIAAEKIRLAMIEAQRLLRLYQASGLELDERMQVENAIGLIVTEPVREFARVTSLGYTPSKADTGFEHDDTKASPAAVADMLDEAVSIVESLAALPSSVIDSFPSNGSIAPHIADTRMKAHEAKRAVAALLKAEEAEA